MESPKDTSFSGNFGRRYTKGLFFETTLSDKSTVKYTLKEKDHQGYPSLKRLYLEEKDPTEYRFASKYLDNYSHWVELCACSWFKPHLEEWRRELELYIKSMALVKIFEEAENTLGKNTFNANKYLLERGWIDKDKNTRGRPSKQQIKEAANQLAQDNQQIEADYERLIN
jgi:hypothetical protein